MAQPLTILYAEDEENDVFFLKRAFKLANSVHALRAVPDGAQAIEYLAGEGIFADRTLHPLPDLILLDINMPKRSGLDVLKWVRNHPRYKSLPTLILTSSERTEDIEKARELGANDYLLKPSDPASLVELVITLQEHWLSQPTIAPAVAV